MLGGPGVSPAGRGVRLPSGWQRRHGSPAGRGAALFGGVRSRRSLGPDVRRGPPGLAGELSLARRLGGFVALTKPRIIELLLVTTLPTMVVAARGLPRWSLMAATLVGGTLAAGGANAINMVVDRDIDAVMRRTRGRPLVTGDRLAGGRAGLRGGAGGAGLRRALGLPSTCCRRCWP